MTVRKSFLSFAKRILDEKQEKGVCLVIKSREGQGIIADSYITQNLTRSGADNSGVTFHPQPEWHEMSEAAYQAWVEFLAKKDNVSRFFAELSQQDGILVILVNRRVQKMVNNVPGNVLFSI